jgi:hypothetical protein
MIRSIAIALTFGVAALGAGPARAQGAAAEPGWSFAASLYGWLPAISSSADTEVGTVDSDLSASDAIGNLEAAFMGTFEARRDRWGLIGDLVYSDISLSESTPLGRRYSKSTLDTELLMFSGYAAYRAYETPQVAVDVLGGVRAFSLDLDLKLTADRAPRDRSFGGSETWAMPLLGARVIVPFSERWFGTAFGDFGGTGSDDRSWQAFASVGYRFDARWSAQLGYRYLDVSKEIDDVDLNMELYGPLLGATLRF